MLSARRSILGRRFLLGIPRRFSAPSTNEVVVSEVKHMTAVAMKWYDEHDIRLQIDLLTKLRSGIKKTIVSNFKKSKVRLSKTWLPMWISHACTDTEFKPFPKIVEMPGKEVSAGIRSSLANAMLIIKSNNGTPVLDQSEYLSEAVKLTEELNDAVSIERLRQIVPIFEDYANGQISTSFFYSQLLDAAGIFAHCLLPLLHFSELPLPIEVHAAIAKADRERASLHAALLEELSNLEHFRSSERYFVQANKKTDAKDAKATTQKAPTKAIKKKAQLNFVADSAAVVKKVIAEKARKTGSILDIAECDITETATSLECVRLPLDPRRTVRYGKKYAESYAFTTEAKCYRPRRVPAATRELVDASSTTEAQNAQAYKAGVFAPETVAGLLDPQVTDMQDSGVRPELRLMVDNLPAGITPDELRAAFQNCGEVERVWIFRDERATPEEVRNFETFQSNRSKAGKSEADDEALGVPSDELVDEHDEGDHGDDGSVLLGSPTSPSATAKGGKKSKDGKEKDKKKEENKVVIQRNRIVKEVSKTSNYAFVQMMDQRGYERATNQAVRLFGILIQDKSCRVFPTTGFKSFLVEVNQELTVLETMGFLNTLLKGKFECYGTPDTHHTRPVYVRLTFESPLESWCAFDTLLRGLHEINSNALMLARMPDDPLPRRRIPVNVCWTRSQWYVERLRQYGKAEEEEHKRVEMEAMEEHLKKRQQQQQQQPSQQGQAGESILTAGASSQTQSPPQHGDGQEHHHPNHEKHESKPKHNDDLKPRSPDAANPAVPSPQRRSRRKKVGSPIAEVSAAGHIDENDDVEGHAMGAPSSSHWQPASDSAQSEHDSLTPAEDELLNPSDEVLAAAERDLERYLTRVFKSSSFLSKLSLANRHRAESLRRQPSGSRAGVQDSNAGSSPSASRRIKTGASPSQATRGKK